MLFLVHFFLPLLHDHDVKLPNLTFYGGRQWIQDHEFLTFFMNFRIQLQEISTNIWQIKSR